MSIQTYSQTPTSIIDLVRSVAVHIGAGGQFSRFKKLYAHDRIAFVYDILPTFAKTIAPYQEEILGYFDEGYRRVSVRGPHGLGKTALASVLTNHSVLTAETDCKVVTTASAWRQLEKYLWPEIKKTARFLDWVEIGREKFTREELLSMAIKLNGGIIEAFAVASDDHTTIEGAHATRMVYIFDESKTIPRPTWDAAEGAFSTEGLQASEYERGILPVGKRNAEEKQTPVEVGGGIIGKVPYKENSKVGNDSQDEYSDEDEYDDVGAGESAYVGESASTRSNSPQIRQQLPAAPVSSPSSKSSAATNGTQLFAGHEDHRERPHVISTASSIYEALAFAISTPGDPSGQFYDIHMHKPGYEDWHTRHVTVDEAIAAGRISRTWVEQRAKQWGETSSVYQNRVLGEFADETEEGVIPLSWIRAAVQRWYVWESKGFSLDGDPDIRTIGVDVARAGEDKTVLAVRNGWGVHKIHTYSKLSTTSNAGHVKSICAGHKVHIEMDGGLGASVYDILKEEGVRGLVPITVSANTSYHDRSGELGFVNVRAAMWWNMRELLDPTYNSVIKLPPIDMLITDLSAPHWEMKKDAKVLLESKDSIRVRLGRSTDYGDAVCLAFWRATRGGGVVV